MSRGFFFAVLSVCSLLVVPAQATTTFDAWGGPGDRSFRAACPSGQYLRGFYGRSGGWVDQIGISCAPVGTGATTTNYDAYGGTGGGPTTAACSGSGLLSKVAVWITSGRQVRQVHGTCDNGAQFEYGARAVGYSDSFREMACPAGEAAIGIHGRVGRHVNAVGLICDRTVFLTNHSFEINTDRPASDFRKFVTANAVQCNSACRSDAACGAWTWVKPNFQGPDAQCYLKARPVPSPVANRCCTSGLKN